MPIDLENLVADDRTPGLVESCDCDTQAKTNKLIDVAEARARIDGLARPVEGTEVLPLAASLGRVLAAPVRAQALTPPFDNAAMDGYAVASAAFTGSGPWVLDVTARVPAGGVSQRSLSGLDAARIFTGAPVPAGADAVVMQEEVRREGATIHVARRPAPGLNIREAGGDMMPGDLILEAGTRMGPREIAAAAAAGQAGVQLRRRVRVALLVTGDEISPAGAALGDAAIWDVNTPMLAADLAQPLVELVSLSHGADSRAGLSDQLRAMAASADLIVTSGGISVGEEDHVKPALTGLGGDILFSGVAIKPGKPVSFGRLGTAFWLGLPGNPLSAFVTWRLFGTALLRVLTGENRGSALARQVVTAQAITRKPGRAEYRLAQISGRDEAGREIVSFAGATHSARVANLPAADGLIILPADCATLPEGARVEFIPFCNA